MTLPNDVARCIGHTVGGTSQLRMECLGCLRRLAPRAEVVVWREPPTAHPCPERIEPEDRK